MKKIRLGPGFAVFVIFFGIAVLQAVRGQDWPAVIFWVITGAAFIMADNFQKARR